LASVAAGDRQNASAQNLRQPVRKSQQIAWINDHRRKLLSERKPPFGLRENHHPTVRSGPPPANPAEIFLLANGWARGPSRPGGLTGNWTHLPFCTLLFGIYPLVDLNIPTFRYTVALVPISSRQKGGSR